MQYLNMEMIQVTDPKAFRNQRPYPWMNPQGLLTQQGFEELLANMPDLALFKVFFAKKRKYGQKSHNRYVLEYQDGLDLPAPWQAFIDELRSDLYGSFIKDLLGRGHIRFRFHWHYTPSGCVVSPHCDSRGKLGSHIFYMNSTSDWDPAWGGQTVILNDNGRFETGSSPWFDDFDEEIPAETMNNRSLIFGRKGNSWHGVRDIHCPEGVFRKVFIVVFQDVNPRKLLLKRVKRLLRGQPLISENEKRMY
jgi:hypothetical protein